MTETAYIKIKEILVEVQAGEESISHAIDRIEDILKY